MQGPRSNLDPAMSWGAATAQCVVQKLLPAGSAFVTVGDEFERGRHPAHRDGGGRP